MIKRRKYLSRGKPPKRSRKPIPRKVRVKPYNAKRRGHRFAKHVNEPLRAYVRTQPCILFGKPGHICNSPRMACHVKPWGSSGEDDDNVFSACLGAHRKQEGRTAAFNREWGVDCKAEAMRLTAAFYAKEGACRKGEIASRLPF